MGTSMMADDVMTLWPASMYQYYSGEYTFDFTIPNHLRAGSYNLYCTAMDMYGNVAEITPTSDFVTADVPIFILQENDPDMTVPVVSGFTLTGATVALTGATDQAKVSMVVTVDDGEWETSDNYDMFSSTIDTNTNAVWSTLCMMCDGTDDMSLPFIYNTYDSDTGAQEWGVALFFSNMMEPGVWTVSNIMARDTAGNTNTMALTTGNKITITYDTTALDAAGGAFSCQTVTATDDITRLTSVTEITVTGSDDGTIYLDAACTLKTSAYNYVVVAYQSMSYLPDSPSTEMMMTTLWDNYAAAPSSDGMYLGVLPLLALATRTIPRPPSLPPATPPTLMVPGPRP